MLGFGGELGQNKEFFVVSDFSNSPKFEGEKNTKNHKFCQNQKAKKTQKKAFAFPPAQVVGPWQEILCHNTTEEKVGSPQPPHQISSGTQKHNKYKKKNTQGADGLPGGSIEASEWEPIQRG